MDRDRLKNIQTADISDSNINEEFVHWLKTKAPSYVLIVMVVIVAYLFFVRYRQGQSAYRAEAWFEFLEAKNSGLPASLEDVALTYADVDSIGTLGLLSAADTYLQSTIIGKTVGNDQNISKTLTAEDRTFYLEKADDLYRRVVAFDNKNETSALFAVSGLYGRAAVAEANGDIDNAKGFYEAVIARIENLYPALANQAQHRIETLSPLAQPIILPSDVEVDARNNQVLSREPVPSNDAIEGLIDLPSFE